MVDDPVWPDQQYSLNRADTPTQLLHNLAELRIK
jgi:hypothetical protein